MILPIPVNKLKEENVQGTRTQLSDANRFTLH